MVPAPEGPHETNEFPPGKDESYAPIGTSWGLVNHMMNDPIELNWVRGCCKGFRKITGRIFSTNINLKELWDTQFTENDNLGGLGSTPGDLWNFSSDSYTFPNPNETNVMDWNLYP